MADDHLCQETGGERLLERSVRRVPQILHGELGRLGTEVRVRNAVTDELDLARDLARSPRP